MIFDTYNCSANPFAEHISLNSLYLDERVSTAINSLKHLPELGDLATLTGRTGQGKTTVARKLMEYWRPNYDVYYVHLGNLKGAGLFRAILTTLGEIPRMGKDRMFQQLFAQLSKKQRPICLIMDEAQLMDIPSMTDLRLLCGNLELMGRLKLILSGQPQMGKTLKAESLTDFRERLTLQINLKPMTMVETISYMEHRLRIVGGKLNIFEEDALKLIANYGEGVPRRVNTLAFKSMLNAAQKGEKCIDATCVREVCSAEST